MQGRVLGWAARVTAPSDWPELLFDVTAVLTTSAALGSVAEAFGVHEISQFSTVQSSSQHIPAPLSLTVIDLAGTDLAGTDLAAADLVSTDGSPDLTPNPSPDELVQGSRLLGQIALLPVADIAEFVRDNPDAIATLIGSPPQARDVALWWGSMGLDARSALRFAAPELVGNLDGLPYSIRDLANRTHLSTTMQELEHTIATELGRTAVEKAKLQLSMLQSISNALGESTAGPTARPTNRTLLSLDVTGQGRAAIVVGSLKDADYVTYMVPGMFFTIEGQMVYWTDAAARLRDEQLSWLALSGDTTSTVATVAWIGYHTPNLTNVGSLENAEEARDSLAHAIEGLQTLRAGAEPFVTIIGHSYGSTAALMALTEYEFEIDALAVVGSAGSAAQSVDELNVKNGNVYVGKAQWDPVPNSAMFGSEPGSPDYGATTFGTDGGRDPITGQDLLRSFFHIEYFSPGTESLRNLALIGIGQGSKITLQ